MKNMYSKTTAPCIQLGRFLAKIDVWSSNLYESSVHIDTDVFGYRVLLNLQLQFTIIRYVPSVKNK